ncbi:MAG TPA: carboxylating nicotinate-nucleotide diphosphorylase [Cryomorphaceae bacterium]|nr:carboxylating nicotinate-nucleotide diphosphorylase [Cryomorphaceae bacterium]|tara:strand:+ start:1956 stop:2822 length:867 start_codon:yes stop_codon:yes gene_type:complete
MTSVNWTPDFKALQPSFDLAIAEDIGDGDHSSLSCLDGQKRGRARLIIKDPGIIAGVALAEYLFKYIDTSAVLNVFIEDGSSIKPGDIIFEVEGNAVKLLQSERLVLNYMQRLSGIATSASKYAAMISHTKCSVLDTRKTTPGLRTLEKWAVQLGGGGNHRMGLYDMIMLKDNHIDFAGGILPAVERVRTYLKSKDKDLKIEVETRDMSEVHQALEADADRIMLDNFTLAQTVEAVALIGDKAETESSGGITKKTLVAYAECGVDFISIGALTHQIASLDMSLKAIEE